MCNPSFVNNNSLKKLTTVQFITICKSDSRKILENYDLTDVNFSNVADKKVLKNFDGYTIKNVIFSRFNPSKKDKKHLYGLSFIGAKLERVCFAQAFLEKCNFDNNPKTDYTEVKLQMVDFFYSELSYCRFSHCSMNKVDFRYAKVSDCSMREVSVSFGDFYFCNFKGCSAFQSSKFISCSFTNSVFENSVILWDNIEGLLQDDYEIYRDIIENPDYSWFRYNPCGKLGDFSNDKIGVLKEATEIYRQLSGIYAGKGLYNHSNKAYTKMKKLYRKSIYASIKSFHWRDLIKDIYNLVLEYRIAFLGYGYKWGRVVFLYGLLIFFGAFCFYENAKSAKIECNFNCDCDGDCLQTMKLALQSLSFSVYNSVGSYVETYTNVVGSFFAATQTILGLFLIGYLGFIFANKIRNNL